MNAVLSDHDHLRLSVRRAADRAQALSATLEAFARMLEGGATDAAELGRYWSAADESLAALLADVWADAAFDWESFVESVTEGVLQ